MDPSDACRGWRRGADDSAREDSGGGPMKCMNRPAKIVSGHEELDAEYRAARWTYHRLLDFEDQHQRLLDEVAEQCAPGIRRVARLIAILWRRQRREIGRASCRGRV